MREEILIIGILVVCLMACFWGVSEKDVLMIAVGGFIGALNGTLK